MLSTLSKGNTIDEVSVLVEKRVVSTAKNGKAFLSLTVRDKETSINAKLWDYKESDHGFVKEGEVVKIWASVDEYNGVLQLIIKGIQASSEPPESFMKSTKFNIPEMWSELVDLVGTFQEPLTKFVTEEILLKHEPFIDAFKKAPAARVVHNAWYGGLLEHVHALCRIAEPVIQHYKTRYCEKLSREKVLFGLIMHDAGKIVEYDYTKSNFKPTSIGLLTNHLVLGPAWVFEVSNRFPVEQRDEHFKEERALLMHVLAAHHGRLDWGSPVVPVTLEAILVHHIDNLDAKMMHAMDYVSGKPGETEGFSERSHIERTPYYQYRQ